MDYGSKIYIDVPMAAKITAKAERTIRWRFKKGLYADTRLVDSQRGGGVDGQQIEIALHCFTPTEQDNYFKISIPQPPQAGTTAPAAPAQSGAIETPVDIQTGPPPLVPTAPGNPSGQAEFTPLYSAPEGVAAAAVTALVHVPKSLQQIMICLPEISRKPQTGLAKWQKDNGACRADLVALYARAKAAAKENQVSAAYAADEFIKLYNTGLPFPDLYKKLGPLTEPTLAKWQSILKHNDNNPDALASRHGMHRLGTTKISDEEILYVITCCLQSSRPPIDEAIHNALGLMRIDGIQPQASVATYRRAVHCWRDRNYAFWTFHREGQKNWEDKCRPYLERDDSFLTPGDVLVADGHKFNFTCIDPETGKPARPTVLLFFDWKSRMPAGWYIMMQENTQCIHAALRRAILRLGRIPGHVLLDNGRAFRAKHFNSVKDFNQAGMVGLYARLGISVHFAKPYNAQSKVVERFFGTVAQFERLIHTYVGTSIDQKPPHLRRNEKVHKRLYDAQHGDRVPSMQEVDLALAIWVEQIYSQNEHGGLRGAIPAELWRERQTSELDRDALRVLMMTTAKKKIDRNGVSHMGSHYWDQALYNLREEVSIRYDIEEPEQIHVYSNNEAEFICTALRREKTHPLACMSTNPADMALVKRLNKEQQQLFKQTSANMRKFTSAICMDVRNGLIEAKEPEQLMLTEAEAREIEEQAAQIVALPVSDEKIESILYDDEGDFYMHMLQRKAEGQQLSAVEIERVAAYEATDEYAELQSYYARHAEQYQYEFEAIKQGKMERIRKAL